MHARGRRAIAPVLPEDHLEAKPHVRVGVAAGEARVRLKEGLDAVGHRADAVVDGGKLVGVHGR